MEIQEWMAQRKFLQGNLLYGIELERNIPKTDQDIYRAFKINPNYNKKWGYQRWHYQHDGSVHNGNEIILSGENFTYREMHKVLEDFEKAIDKMSNMNIKEIIKLQWNISDFENLENVE